MKEQFSGDGFTISYISSSLNVGGISFFSGDGGGAETALIDERGGKRGKCLILNGDWREAYRSLLPQGYDACLAFYEDHKKDYRSSWSEDFDN
jgi:hypothetical protein